MERLLHCTVYPAVLRQTRHNNLTQGVFHVELKYTARGPRLIEVNCRMGGGPVRLTNLLVWGVDLVEEHLLTTAGIPSRPPVWSRPGQTLPVAPAAQCPSSRGLFLGENTFQWHPTCCKYSRSGSLLELCR